jgi:YHS domain-containing protein
MGGYPLGFEEFCPVSLLERHNWQQGDPRFAAVHRGRAYVFASEADRETFIGNAERYVPAAAGLDPVMASQGRQVAGVSDYTVIFDGRICLFANENTLTEFMRHPDRYSAEFKRSSR